VTATARRAGRVCEATGANRHSRHIPTCGVRFIDGSPARQDSGGAVMQTSSSMTDRREPLTGDQLLYNSCPDLTSCGLFQPREYWARSRGRCVLTIRDMMELVLERSAARAARRHSSERAGSADPRGAHKPI
jgi:hypothetical protein